MKTWQIALILALPCLGARASMRSVRPKILMVVDQGYRPEEYFEPRALFDQAGFEVKVAALHSEPVLPSRPHLGKVPPLQVDITVERVTAGDFDAIVFVGGNGAWNEFLPSRPVHQLLFESVKQGKITGLICAATGLLATAGNLSGRTPHFRGRRATGYFEVEGILTHLGGIHYDEGDPSRPFVVADGNLITGRDPSSAGLFGETIIKSVNDLRMRAQ